MNADNPTFIFKDPEQQNQSYTLLPAFVLYAHTESAFWKNWLTVAEYTVDILTTLSGFGNIIKVGRLYKIVEAGKTQIFTKIVTGVKGVAGVAEISSGSVNILLKLTGANDTELGREISKYLFYFEMIALSGELSLALYNKMNKSAKAILAKEKLLRESAKNADETKQIDELIEELRRVAGDNITGKGLYGGKILSKSDLEKWTKLLKEKYGTNLVKVDSFENPNILAQFDPNTNTIRYKDDVIEYFMLHESFHAEEFKKIGFDEYVKDAPLKGVKEVDYTNENWIRLYKREKHVYEQIDKNAKKHSLNNEELNHAFYCFDGKVVLELEKRNIKIPKS